MPGRDRSRSPPRGRHVQPADASVRLAPGRFQETSDPWPERWRRRPSRPTQARGNAARSASGPGSFAFTAPVALLDFLDLLFAEPEVVPDLMDQRLRDAAAHIVFGLAVFLDDGLEERDAVR